jgi:acetyl esterase
MNLHTRDILLLIAATAFIIALGSYVALQCSRWPAALFYRTRFDHNGVVAARAIEKYVPPQITGILNLRYGADDADALLDLFYPTNIIGTTDLLPTVVWIHGGGYLSGSKDQIANYLKILAGEGFTVVGINYSLAPGETYPTPVRQANRALAFIEGHAAEFHADASNIFLAGDSAGAQIAAQLANVISSPEYAKEVGITPAIERQHVKGVVLHSGLYGIDGIVLQKLLPRTMFWSYFGRRDFVKDQRLAEFSIAPHITSDFPAMFISVGNADPLEEQSKLLAETVARHGGTVERLFFPPDHKPALPHEYQFNVGGEAGQLALKRSAAFIREHRR